MKRNLSDLVRAFFMVGYGAFLFFFMVFMLLLPVLPVSAFRVCVRIVERAVEIVAQYGRRRVYFVCGAIVVGCIILMVLRALFSHRSPGMRQHADQQRQGDGGNGIVLTCGLEDGAAPSTVFPLNLLVFSFL